MNRELLNKNVRFDESKTVVDAINNSKQSFRTFSYLDFPEDDDIFPMLDDVIESENRRDNPSKMKESSIHSHVSPIKT